MEPQARHEEKAWQGYIDDESYSLRFQLQPPRAFLFLNSFFHPAALGGDCYFTCIGCSF